MIIEFIIALVVYDVAKFLGGILIVICNKDKAVEEIEIQKEVKAFEEELRGKKENRKSFQERMLDKMENKESSPN